MPSDGTQSSTSVLLFLLDSLLSKDERAVLSSLIKIDRTVREKAGIILMPDGEGTVETIMSTRASPLLKWTSSMRPEEKYTIDLCQILQVLLDVCPSFASTISLHDGSLPLHFAASLGNVPLASIILSKYPPAATTPNSKGKIPLHYAAREGRLDVVHFFLHSVPATASLATEKRKLALHFAAGDGHVEVCRALLSVYPQGATLPSAKGKVPLHFCARWGHMEIAYDLIRVYPDAVRALDWEGSLPLHDAAREGQSVMARYLVELFPTALSTANLRNEIPLFPAVRSGDIDLVALLVQAWPAGSKFVLQNLSVDDNVNTGWMSWEILELLLRGAVQKLAGCSLLKGREPPNVRLIREHWSVITQPSHPASSKPKKTKNIDVGSTEGKQSNKKLKVRDTRLEETDHRYIARIMPYPSDTGIASSPANSTCAFTSDAAIAAGIRSKSPILENADDFILAKKQGKRSRQSSHDSTSHHDNMTSFFFHVPEEKRKFIPLHAVFESGASCHVIEYVLNQRAEDMAKKDECGMLPLHWAVTQCNREKDTAEEREMIVNMITEKLLPATSDGAYVRDLVYNRLPLHFAIIYRADVTVIKALLASNPSAGVKPCKTRDSFHDKTPLQLATHFDCDLGTIYELLKADPSFVTRETIKYSS